MTVFSEEIVSAVVRHMNEDHAADSLVIAKAHGFASAIAAKMLSLDENAGIWEVVDPAGTHELRVPWPGGEIAERAEIRREIVALFEGAKEVSAADKPFSVVIREGSWGAHSDAEGADFMANIMRGISPLQDYVDLVIQHYYVYEALEGVVSQLDADDATAPFNVQALLRMETLERDLAHFLGENWREQIAAVPATAEYAARIRELAAEGWLPGIVAHHYTRYLGDLSGGQMIAKRMRQQHGLETAGVEFYDFASLGDLTEFKNEYRTWLDALGASLSAAEKERFLTEVGKAYELNTRVFIDLSAQKQTRQAD